MYSAVAAAYKCIIRGKMRKSNKNFRMDGLQGETVV